jgi:hypothetical protein
MTLNLVTDLQSQFPHEEGGEPHLVAHRSNGHQYILQFEGGDLIGAVVFNEAYSDELARLISPRDETPKLEVVRS